MPTTSSTLVSIEVRTKAGTQIENGSLLLRSQDSFLEEVTFGLGPEG